MDRKPKYKKAPQAPKRFKSAYMYFSLDMHQQFRSSAQKKISSIEVAKMISKAWKELSADQKKKYHDLSQEDRNRYESEKANYKGPWRVKTDGEDNESDSSNPPKRPAAPFLLYMNTIRPTIQTEHPELSGDALTRKVATSWKELTDERRQRYLDEATTRRERYRHDMREWHQKSRSTFDSFKKGKSDIDDCEDSDKSETLGIAKQEDSKSSLGSVTSRHTLYDNVNSPYDVMTNSQLCRQWTDAQRQSPSLHGVSSLPDFAESPREYQSEHRLGSVPAFASSSLAVGNNRTDADSEVDSVVYLDRYTGHIEPIPYFASGNASTYIDQSSLPTVLAGQNNTVNNDINHNTKNNDNMATARAIANTTTLSNTDISTPENLTEVNPEEVSKHIPNMTDSSPIDENFQWS